MTGAAGKRAASGCVVAAVLMAVDADQTTLLMHIGRKIVGLDAIGTGRGVVGRGGRNQGILSSLKEKIESTNEKIKAKQG